MPTVKINACLNCSGKNKPVNHEFIFDGMTLRELRDIKKITGMSQVAFAQAGDEGDPEAIAALIWILHKRNKILVPFDEIDLDFGQFEMVLSDEEQVAYDEAMGSDGIDPKQAKNGTRKKAGQ